MAFSKLFPLVGTAATLLCGGACAADLSVKKPSSVEYVKVCTAYGAGFFYIPGSNSCLKLGGRVRAEVYLYQPKHGGFNASNTTGFRSQAHIQLDARTATEYGTVRTFVRLLLISRTGRAVSGSQQRYGTSTVATGADFTNNAQTNVDLLAFVQFAGFTAGRTGSFADYYKGDITFQPFAGNGNNLIAGGTNLFAYTYSWSNGLSATLSVEDSIERRNLILSGRNDLVAAGNVAAAARGSYYGGAQTPDIVANLRYDGGWGSAQLAGVLHEVVVSRVSNVNGANTLRGSDGAAPAIGAAVSRDYGFAFLAGTKLNLPFIATGDLLILQAAYGRGTVSYTDGLGQNGAANAVSTVVDPYNPQSLVDGYAYADAAGRARVSLSDSFNILVGYRHYWTPTVRQAVYGSYTNVQYDRAAAPIVPTVAGITGIGSVTRYDQFQVGGNVVWSPVKDLDIGAEVQYNYTSSNNRAANYASRALPVGVTNTGDNVIGRIRVQRDF